MSLKVWHDQGLIITHVPSGQETSNLLAIMDVDLKDAQIPELSGAKTELLLQRSAYGSTRGSSCIRIPNSQEQSESSLLCNPIATSHSGIRC